MKKIYSLLLLSCLTIAAFTGRAQTAASYVFSQSTTTYSALSSPTNIFTGSWDDNVSNALSIGFNFVYCGNTYSTFNINANGWINFGGSTSSSYTAISARTYALAPFSNDLYYNSAYSGTVTSQLTGSSPNRVFTIQWLNCCHYSTAATGPLNFQIKLYETSNIIEFVYGTFAPTTAGSYSPQVGINGATSSDYNNRATTSNWSTTTAGGSNTATCSQTQTLNPASGLVFRWTPPCTSVPTPTGSSSVCMGSTITLSDATSGGTWSSGTTTVATVNGSGVVTGVSGGSANILYTVSGCSASKTITVTPGPVVTAIATPSVICSGGSTSLNGTATNPGAGYGVSSITYVLATQTSPTTVSFSNADDGTTAVTIPFSFNYYGTNYTSINIGTNGYVQFGGASTTFSVAAFPTAALPGAIAFCWGDLDVLSPGAVTYSTEGTAPNRSFVIKYNQISPCCSYADAYDAEVILYEGSNIIDILVSKAASNTHTCGIQNPAGTSFTTPSGRNGVSYGITTPEAWRFSLPQPTFGWVADPTLSSTTIANPTAGPIAVTTTYTAVATASNGCSATGTITVNVSPAPAPLTGFTTLCQAGTTTLTSTAGGTWASSNNGIATVASGTSTTGIVTGVSAGSCTITYAFGASCIVTKAVTVLPTAPVTGPSTVCPGLTIQMSDAMSGGTWTSSNTNFATVDPVTGLVTGVAAGTPDIIYTLPTTCARSKNITVNPLPAVITGASAICKGLNTILTETTTGGVWSSTTTTIATVGSLSATTANVFGVDAGTSVITYTLPTTCIRTLTMVVNPLPVPITVPASGVCITNGVNPAVTLTDGTPLGTWSSSDPTVGTINTTTGTLTGITAGSTIITYTLPTGCIMTQNVIVSSLPANISGNRVVCANAVTYLTDSLPGGFWTSSNTTMATIGFGTGIVNGQTGYASPVNPVITYKSLAGCVAVATLTVNPAPGAVTGTKNICVASTYTLTAAGGGTWASSNSGLASVTTSGGAVTGVVPGNPFITYTLPSTGCFSVTALTVNPTPAAITPAIAAVCYGSTITLNDATAGGTWSTTSTIASVSPIGLVTPTFAGGGIVNVDYSLSTGCKASQTVTVNTLPAVYNLASFTGASSYCYNDAGIDLYLNASTIGVNYQLYNSGVPVPGVLSGTGGAVHFGNQTGAGTYTAIGTYTATTGCANNMTGSPSISIDPLPLPFNLKYVGASSSYCDVPGGGVQLYLDSSETTAEYTLFFNGGPLPAIPGTGSSISFGSDTQGVYTASALNPSTGCRSKMIGTIKVGKNQLPSIHNVIYSDSGFYCAGTSGVHVGVDYGNIGVVYELYNGGPSPVAAKTGANASIDFGLKTAGIYTVIARNPFTGCTQNMNGAALVSVRALPVATHVVSAKSPGYCLGGTGDTIMLLSSDATASYQLMLGSAKIDSPIAGTGGKLSFGPQYQGGNYTVYARSIGTVCGQFLSTSANVAVYPALLAGKVTLENNGEYCSGSGGVHVYLDTSSAGVIYEVYNSGLGSPVLMPMAGTGGRLVFAGLDSVAGITRVLATSTGAGGCQAWMTGSPVVKVNALPAANVVTATNSGNYCVGGNGVNIGLAFSDIGVSYQLFKGITPIGSTQPGSNASLDFGVFKPTGTYTITGKNVATGCVNNMAGSAVVTINPNPTVYNMTGGGSYCAGTTTGVPVGVFSTDAGINYQLYHNSLLVGSVVPGSGGAITFGNQIVAGLYSVVGTDAVTGCTSNMSGSKVVTIDPLPVAYSVTGGGDYCAGGTGVHIGLSNSVTGNNYYLKAGGAVIATMPGTTGSTLDFGLRTAGAYTIEGVNVISKCTNNMTGTAVVNANPLPVPYPVAGGGGYCAGDAGATVYMVNSEPGVNYQLFMGTTPAPSAAVLGTGGKLDLGLQTAGTYTAVGVNAATGCKNNMSGSVTVTTNPLPDAYAVTGGGTMCAGSAGFHIYLTGSQAGKLYSLYNGGGSPVKVMVGSGSALDFGAQTGNGAYTVIATDSLTNCVRSMTGAGNILVNPAPTAFAISGGAHYCSTGSGVLLSLLGSENGVNYQLYRSASSVGMPVGGTGTIIDFGLLKAGTYTVKGLNTNTLCAADMTGAAVVIEDKPVTPAVKIDSTHNGVACVGELVKYVATPTDGGSAPAYVWKSNGVVVVGIGDTYRNIPATGDVISVEMTSNAYCVSTNKATNSITMTSVPYSMPTAVTSITPGNNICSGTAVKLTAATTFEGNESPGYAWMKNGAFVGSGTTYSYTPANKDVVVFRLLSTYHCAMADTVFSDPVVMTVDDAIVPNFTVTSRFGPSVDSKVGVGKIDTFTATINDHIDLNYTYQWFVEGTLVPGANQPVYIDHGVYNNDVVSCQVTKVGACGNQSAIVKITVVLKNLGAQTLATVSEVSVLPNPNKGEFTVKGTLGTTADEEVSLEITNMLGQTVYTNKVMTQSGNINEHIKLSNTLANGMYLLNVRSGATNNVFHVVIEQ
ncbi:MAG: hypothetical protein JWQ38_2346 [Flavipsychrobacter sp.]|nr:hypothetical protein [Flavipsychrobacter sp.]